MSLSKQEVEHVASLVRLKLSKKELEEFEQQLSQILDHIQSLQELDTSGVQPTSGILASDSHIRPDEPSPGLTIAEVLGNAARTEDGQFKVPPVFGARDE
jgi:aspartyl-tRNA(Asn)/glutamyl-tRNA(Gln) amidotransferase subunit C